MRISGDEATLRLRLRSGDTHYPSSVIPAGSLMAYMGDAGTLLRAQNEQDPGFLVRWEGADFIVACFIGDFVEVRAQLVSTGNRSWRVLSTVHKLVGAANEIDEKAGVKTVFDPPLLVASGTYVGAVPRYRG
ncbi:hypothetical protein [Dactylosporangium sp. CA-233914]|uniref:hypothetical protein n=1 Tax=Dactylosporangium sp. CA-233914 TaxID=3239934 RepID=UPI003D93B16D